MGKYGSVLAPLGPGVACYMHVYMYTCVYLCVYAYACKYVMFIHACICTVHTPVLLPLHTTAQKCRAHVKTQKLFCARIKRHPALYNYIQWHKKGCRTLRKMNALLFLNISMRMQSLRLHSQINIASHCESQSFLAISRNATTNLHIHMCPSAKPSSSQELRSCLYNLQLHTHSYIHTYIHTHISFRLQVCDHAFNIRGAIAKDQADGSSVSLALVCMYVCMHVCISIRRTGHLQISLLYAYMYVCMNVCMYACMHQEFVRKSCFCMHACMYEHVYLMYACMCFMYEHICMHVCMYAFRPAPWT